MLLFLVKKDTNYLIIFFLHKKKIFGIIFNQISNEDTNMEQIKSSLKHSKPSINYSNMIYENKSLKRIIIIIKKNAQI